MPRTLCQALLSSLDKPAFAIANELGISPTSLSKHAAGILKKPSVLRKLSVYLTEKIGGEIPITADHLLTNLSPQVLVLASHHVLKRHLAKGT